MFTTIQYFISFFYLYSVHFIFLPSFVGTRPLLGLFGFILVVVQIFNKKKIILSNKSIKGGSLFVIFILFSTITTTLYNAYDYFILKYFLSVVIILFASYFVINIFTKINPTFNYTDLFQIIINTVTIQMFIAILLVVFPNFSEVINSIQFISKQKLEIGESIAGFRLVGFGSSYFNAGILNGIALLMISALITLKKNSKLISMILIFQFLFILSIGINMSRTTIVGAVLAILYLLFNIFIFKHKSFRIKKFPFIFLISLVGTIVSIATYIIINIDTFSNESSAFIRYALEFLFSYIDHGSLSTGSTNTLQSMYRFPNNMSTYIVGDGYFNNPSGNGYYMHIDVGYLRLLYYTGGIGMIFYFLIQFQLIKEISNKIKDRNNFFYLLFIYVIILNFKGMTDIYYILFLFLFLQIHINKKRLNCEKNTNIYP